jgi:hypothetical protein
MTVARARGSCWFTRDYTLLMAMEYVVQRLQIGDVVLIDRPEQGEEVEAKVVRAIDRTDTTVRVSLQVEGRDDFVKEWPIDALVTVVRGP